MSIKNTFMKATGMTLLKAKKVAPELMIVTGLAGMTMAMVMIFKKADQASDILDEHKDMAEEIRDNAKDEKARRKEMTKAYAKTTKKFATTYGPAVGLYIASCASILGGHNIVRKRYASAVAAYKVLETSFDEYRERVREAYGEEVDRNLKHGITKKDISIIETDEKGNEKEKKIKGANVAESPSQYARFFDEGCPNWEKTPEYNLMFLKAQQNYVNELLQVRGFVFLNEVYRILGIPETSEGQLVGWVKGNGDDFIDFGIYDLFSQKHRDFVNGYENVILLDFNVDGIIFDKI